MKLDDLLRLSIRCFCEISSRYLADYFTCIRFISPENCFHQIRYSEIFMWKYLFAIFVHSHIVCWKMGIISRLDSHALRIANFKTCYAIQLFNFIAGHLFILHNNYFLTFSKFLSNEMLIIKYSSSTQWTEQNLIM